MRPLHGSESTQASEASASVEGFLPSLDLVLSSFRSSSSSAGGAPKPGSASVDLGRSSLRFLNSFNDATYFGIPFAGLCGGMAYTTLDYFMAGRPAPSRTTTPSMQEEIGQYVRERQWDSLVGKHGVRFFALLANADDTSVGRSTEEAFGELRKHLDAGQPMPIGLVPWPWTANLARATEAHQVVARGYVASESGALKVDVWDPNRPDEAHTWITYTGEGAGPNVWIEDGGARWRGFFVEDGYRAKVPPETGEKALAKAPGGEAAGPSKQTTSDLRAELPALKAIDEGLRKTTPIASRIERMNERLHPPAETDAPLGYARIPRRSLRLRGAFLASEASEVGDTASDAVSTGIAVAAAACAAATSETGVGPICCGIAAALAKALAAFSEWLDKTFKDTFHPDASISEAWLTMMRMHPILAMDNVDDATNPIDGANLVRYFRIVSEEVKEGQKGNNRSHALNNPHISTACDNPYQCAEDPDEPMTSAEVLGEVQRRYNAWAQKGKKIETLSSEVPTFLRHPADARTILAMMRKYPKPFKAIAPWSEIQGNLPEIQEQLRALRRLAGEEGKDPGGILQNIFGGDLSVKKEPNVHGPWQQFYPFVFNGKTKRFQRASAAELKHIEGAFAKELDKQGVSETPSTRPATQHLIAKVKEHAEAGTRLPQKPTAAPVARPTVSAPKKLREAAAKSSSASSSLSTAVSAMSTAAKTAETAMSAASQVADTASQVADTASDLFSSL